MFSLYHGMVLWFGTLFFFAERSMFVEYFHDGFIVVDYIVLY